jgi:hypothetical protein
MQGQPKYAFKLGKGPKTIYDQDKMEGIFEIIKTCIQEPLPEGF